MMLDLEIDQGEANLDEEEGPQDTRSELKTRGDVLHNPQTRASFSLTEGLTVAGKKFKVGIIASDLGFASLCVFMFTK